MSSLGVRQSNPSLDLNLCDMKPSYRLESVPASPIRKLVPFAQEAKNRGVTVYHLNIGDPDIQTPPAMLDVLKNWDRNPIGYDQSQGNPEFLKSLVWYYRKIGFPFIKDTNIQVTTGGSEAISMAMFAVCESGDEILVFEPLYANYNSYAVVNGVRLVPVTTDIKNGFHLPSRAEIEKRINPKTKAILICNPNNPTGTVYTKREIEMLVAVAQERDLFILSDEVYREYCYTGTTHTSLLAYMETLPDRIIILDSMSKRYSLCGARLGCLVSLNPDIMSGVLHIAQGRLSSGLVDQLVSAKLTQVPDSYLQEVNREYEARRDLVYNGLSRITGVTIPRPEGAFYAIVGLPVSDAEDFCKYLLTDFRDNNQTVMLAPAAGFYATPGKGKNEVRVAYVINRENLARAVDILEIALREYKKTRI